MQHIQITDVQSSRGRFRADSKYIVEVASIDLEIKKVTALLKSHKDKDFSEMRKRLYQELSNEPVIKEAYYISKNNPLKTAEDISESFRGYAKKPGFKSNDFYLKHNDEIWKRTLTYIIQDEQLKDLLKDPWLGLLWFGYRNNPNYWQQRHQVALRLKRSDYSSSLKSEYIKRKDLSSRLSAAYTHYVGNASRRFRAFVGMCVLSVGGLVIGGSGHFVVNYHEEILSSIKDTIKNSGFYDVDQEAMDDRYDQDFLGTVSADAQAKARKDEKFSVDYYKVPRTPIHYFIMTPVEKIENPINLNLNHSISLKTFNVGHEDKQPDVVINFKKPVVENTPIPSLLNYYVSALAVTDLNGDLVEDGYSLKSSVDGIYNLTFDDSEEIKIKKNIRVYYRYKPQIKQSYTLKNLTSLKYINNELRIVGFDIIADEIDEYLDLNVTIDIESLANIISKVSFYTYRDPISMTYEGETFGSVSQFMRDKCLYGQCSSGNELFYLYIMRYAELTQEKIKPARMVGYYWDNQYNVITGANRHRFSRVYFGDQGDFVHADATPTKMDVIDQGIHELAKDKYSLKKTKLSQKFSYWLNKINEYKSSIYADIGSFYEGYFIKNHQSDGGREEGNEKFAKLYYAKRQNYFEMMFFDDLNFDDELKEFKKSIRHQIIDMLEKYDANILQNKAMKKLPLYLRKGLPITSLYVTIDALTDLRMMKSSYQLAFKKIRNVFPNLPVINQNSSESEQLSALLNDVYLRISQEFEDVRIAATNYKLKSRFQAIASTTVQNPILNLMHAIKSEEWDPVDISFKDKTQCFVDFSEFY